MIKPVGDNIEIHDENGTLTQKFTRVKGIGAAVRYDAEGSFNAQNLSLSEVEAVIVRQAKRKAMEDSRA